MNWAIKIILKTLITKISHISWFGYDRSFYGIFLSILDSESDGSSSSICSCSKCGLNVFLAIEDITLESFDWLLPILSQC